MQKLSVQFFNSPTRETCNCIARLHHESLAGDLLPSLGIKFLETFYLALAKSGQFRFYLVEENNKLLGVLVAADNRKIVSKTLIRHGFFPLSVSVFWASFQKPSLFISVLKAFFYGKEEKGPSEELLFLAVEKNNRSRGLGEMLVQKYMSDLKGIKSNSFQVVVGSKNERALQFYRKVGGAEVEKIKVGKSELTRFIFTFHD